MMRKEMTRTATAILFLSFFGLVNLQTALSQVCHSAPVGLVSWYAADGNALDSRSRLNGTLQNGAGFAAGHAGQAFDFNGTNEAVVADSPSLNFGAGSFSVETWVRADSFPTDYAAVIAKGIPPGTNRWILFRGPLGGFPWRVTLDSGGTTINAVSNSDAPIGQWTHLAFVVDRTSATLKFYVNGVAQTSQPSIAALGSLDSTLPLRVGNDNEGSFFDGQIDEPSIYNRALSASEIQAIFSAGQAGKCKPTATVSPSGQVAWFAGDGNASDSAATNHGTVQNGASFTIGKVGQTFSFDGISGAVTTPPNTLNSAFAAITIEAWVNPSSHGADSSGSFGNTIVSNTEIDGFALRLRSGVIQADLRLTGGNVSPTFGSALPLNQWSHIALTYDGTSVKAFLNGIQTGSSFPASGTIRNSANNGICLMIGNDPGAPCIATNDGFDFHGQIDEVSFYNRALTDAEIQSIFNAGAGGKLKETTSTGTTASVGDVAVTYPTAITRKTQQIPLEESDLPTLPAGMTSTGLFYDVSTDAIPSGTTDLCFNLPSFALLSLDEFRERRVLHLEGGNWTTNQTISWDFATKTICARVPSLSPFAIVDSNLAPSAASVSVGGRVTAQKGRGISGARVSFTDAEGNTRTALTNFAGYFRFSDVPVGETYIFSVFHKRYQFAEPAQAHFIGEERDDLSFTALP